MNSNLYQQESVLKGVFDDSSKTRYIPKDPLLPMFVESGLGDYDELQISPDTITAMKKEIDGLARDLHIHPELAKLLNSMTFDEKTVSAAQQTQKRMSLDTATIETCKAMDAIGIAIDKLFEASPDLPSVSEKLNALDYITLIQVKKLVMALFWEKFDLS